MSYPTIEYSKDGGPNSRDYTLLKEFTLYEFYEVLNNELNSGKKLYERCGICSTLIADRTEFGRELINLCKKICTIIQNMDDVLDQCNGSTCNKSCDYMNLWLYDQAMRITNENFFINSFYQALNLLGGSSKSRKNQCSIKNFQLNQEELNKKQILYEFLHIYDGIKNKLQSQEDDSKIKLYCKHILENFGFYHENKESCTSTELCKYYDELTDFKSKFSNPAELTYIYQKCKYEETTCKNGSKAEDDVPCLREEENSFLYLIFGNDPEDIIKVLLNVTIIFVPILAFFVILFKFTPFKKTLNKLKQERKKSGLRKKEENIQDYMKNYASYLDKEMKNRVHLGYHAT
ncbi:VIR protein [Plasmodium vivax]|uniref:VIR protein n=2 Tax=Plasmodium vivax TaxID=5855 RepID=A0A1G4E855_PLAVI|nr:VIR protein [Plasmodium vivax]